MRLSFAFVRSVSASNRAPAASLSASPEPGAPQRAVHRSPPPSNRHLENRSGEITEKEDLIREASPGSHIHADLPPYLLMHGAVDELVDCGQSERLYRQMKEAGCDVKLIIVPKQGHGFFAGQEYYDEILRFLQQKL